MASTITHAYFIMDVMDKLDIKTKEFLFDKKDFLKTTAQSMDTLFFYNLTNLKKGKRVREFGHYFHNYNVYEFFKTLINYIKYNGYRYNSSVMAYLYGMISHYVLDSTMHPFVIYKTGVFNKNDVSTYKYNHLHERLETYFDNYLILIKKEIKPYKYRCYTFFDTSSFNSELKEVIDFTYKEVFGINNMSKVYIQSINNMRFFYKTFRYDPYGIKVKFYKMIDFFKPRKYLKLDILSYHQPVYKYQDYLNLEHKTWCNPTDDAIKSNKSLIELYTLALDSTVKMITKINQYIYEDKKINLYLTIKNNSYETGRDCKVGRELKYFEF